MRNLKKVLSVVLVFALMLSLTVFAGAAGFADVAKDYQYKNAINLLSALDIIGGYEDGTFQPEKEITRAEFSKILYVVFQSADDVNASMYVGDSSFRDVTKSQWFTGYVNWASNNAVVGGYGDGTFQPDNKIKVKEAIKMIVASVTDKALSYPTGYIQEARGLKLLDDVVMTSVDANATRGQIAQMAYNLLYTPSKLCQVATGEYVNGVEQYKKVAPITYVFELASIGSPDVVTTEGVKVNEVKFAGSFENKFQYDSEMEEGQVALLIDSATSPTLFDYDGDVSDLYGQSVTVYFKESTKGTPRLDVNDEIFSIVPNGGTLNTTLKGLTLSGSTYKVDGNAIPVPELVANTANTKKYYAFDSVLVQDAAGKITPKTDLASRDYNEYFKTTAQAKNNPVTLIDDDNDGAYDIILIWNIVNGAEVDLYNTRAKTIRLQPIGAKAETVKFENAKGVENVAEEDIVNYTFAINGKNEFTVNLTKAETVTGTMGGVVESGASATIGDKTYSVNALYTAFLSDSYDLMSEDVTIYLDSLGQIAKIIAADDSLATDLNLAFVKDATDESTGRNDNKVSAFLTLVLADGTEKTIEVDVKNDQDVNDTEVQFKGTTAQTWKNETRDTLSDDKDDDGFTEYFWAWEKVEKINPNNNSETKEITQAKIVGKYVHYEIDEDTGLISKLVYIEDIAQNPPTRTKVEYDAQAYTDEKLCYSKENGFYKLTTKKNPETVELAADNIFGMSYQIDYFNNNQVTAEYYTKDTMPEFEETGKYILVLADGKVLAMIVTDEGSAKATDSVFGLLKSFKKVAGASKAADGKATSRYEFTITVNGQDEKFYTKDVASAANNISVYTSGDFSDNYKLLVNQLVRVKLDSYGKVVTKKVDHDTDSDSDEVFVADLEYATFGSFKYAVALSANAAGTSFKLLEVDTWVNDRASGWVWETDEFSPNYNQPVWYENPIDGSISYVMKSDTEIADPYWKNTCSETSIITFDGRITNKTNNSTDLFQKMSKVTGDGVIEETKILEEGKAYIASIIAYQTFTSNAVDDNDPTTIYNADEDFDGRLANVIVFTTAITVANEVAGE